MLERSIEVAKAFQTDRVRCFDFWRLDYQAPYRAAMNEKLRNAAEKAAKKDVIQVLENEPACNTATGAEAAKVLAAVTSSNLMLNWDRETPRSMMRSPTRMDTTSCRRTELAIVTVRTP